MAVMMDPELGCLRADENYKVATVLIAHDGIPQIGMSINILHSLDGTLKG
jgi:hypothetical protein